MSGTRQTRRNEADAASAGAPGPSQIWYHGTGHLIDAFDLAHVGTGDDELGPGFYFTDSAFTASGYAMRGGEGGSPNVVMARIALRNPLPPDSRLTAKTIAALLRASPDFLDRLENFGEVEYEGLARVESRAVSTYANQAAASDDVADALFSICNDFWSGQEGAFLVACVAITGHDGLFRVKGDETHAVVWDPRVIAPPFGQAAVGDVDPGDNPAPGP